MDPIPTQSAIPQTPETTSPIANTPEIPPPPKPKFKKILLIVLGSLVGLVLVLGIAGILLSKYVFEPIYVTKQIPTPQTALQKWETFSREEYGFSIEHPSSASIYGGYPDKIVLARFGLPSLTIEHFKNPKGLSPKKFYEEERGKRITESKSNNLPHPIEPTDKRGFMLNGVPSFQFTTFAGDGDILHTYFGVKDKIIDVSFRFDKDENNPNFDPEDARTFLKMLSTFRPINVDEETSYCLSIAILNIADICSFNQNSVAWKRMYVPNIPTYITSYIYAYSISPDKKHLFVSSVPPETAEKLEGPFTPFNEKHTSFPTKLYSIDLQTGTYLQIPYSADSLIVLFPGELDSQTFFGTPTGTESAWSPDNKGLIFTHGTELIYCSTQCRTLARDVFSMGGYPEQSFFRGDTIYYSNNPAEIKTLKLN